MEYSGEVAHSPEDYVTFNKFNSSLFDELYLERVSNSSDTSSLTQDYYLINYANQSNIVIDDISFCAKVSAAGHFENSRIWIESLNTHFDLGAPDRTVSGYKVWDLGLWGNVNDFLNKTNFQAWFHIGKIELPTAEFINVDGTHKGNYFRHVPLPTNSGNTVEQGDALENGWVSDGAGGWDYVYLMVYDGTGDIHDSANYTIINQV